jgi:hypothetical protein
VVKRKPNVNRLVRSRYATNERAPEPSRPGEKCSIAPNIFLAQQAECSSGSVQIVQFCTHES